MLGFISSPVQSNLFQFYAIQSNQMQFSPVQLNRSSLIKLMQVSPVESNQSSPIRLYSIQSILFHISPVSPVQLNLV